MSTTTVKLGWVEKALSECRAVYALLGAPNTGKSTLFNVLTGGKARVGNWPGVTVDFSVGKLGDGLCVVDIPGVYGLGGASLEERVAREIVLSIPIDAVILLVDATMPERSLYLIVTVLEALDKPAVVVITKARLGHGLGVHIDVEGLSRALGLPVLITSALEGVGVDELRELLEAGPTRLPRSAGLRVDYGLAEDAVRRLESRRELGELAAALGLRPRWLAAQLIAGDEHVRGLLEARGLTRILEEAESLAEELKARTGIDPALLIAQARVRLTEKLATAYIVRKKPRGAPGWLDRVFRHPVLGPLAGLGLIFAVFLAAFTVNTGFPLNVIIARWSPRLAGALEEYSLGGLIGAAFEHIKQVVVPHLPPGAPAGLASAVFDGVGIVAGFIPLVGTIVALTAVVEDSGLFTRIAVAFHPLLRRFGLSGRSIYPLAVGTGCNVPAILSTRILDPLERDRAIMAIPFIPCSARFVVISIFASIFFRSPLMEAVAATAIYAASILVALLTARLTALYQARVASKLGGAVEVEPELVMELPPLHSPSAKVVWWATRDALVEYVKKIFGPILVGAMSIWALLSFGPHGYTENITESFAYYIGSVVGQVFKPIGITSSYWVLGLAAIAGAVAKELFADTIAVAAGSPEPYKAIASLALSPAQAFAVLLFATLYIPCIATLAVMLNELRRKKLAVVYLLYSTSIAVLAMYIAYSLLALL